MPCAPLTLFFRPRRPRSFFKKTDWASLELPAPVQDVTHHLLDVGGGVQIHAVRTGGAPEKPILLCVHGFPGAGQVGRQYFVSDREAQSWTRSWASARPRSRSRAKRNDAMGNAPARAPAPGQECAQGLPASPFPSLAAEYWGSWRHQMEAFRDRYDVVAIDMRGYAGSSKPEVSSAFLHGMLVNKAMSAFTGLNHCGRCAGAGGA